MKKFNTFLTVLLAILIGKFALANRHTFSEEPNRSPRPATIDEKVSSEFQTATFALG